MLPKLAVLSPLWYTGTSERPSHRLVGDAVLVGQLAEGLAFALAHDFGPCGTGELAGPGTREQFGGSRNGEDLDEASPE